MTDHLQQSAKPKKDHIVLHGVQVSREAMVRFKRTYKAAVKGKKETFFLDDQEVLVAYAKYVVEYAENELGPL